MDFFLFLQDNLAWILLGLLVLIIIIGACIANSCYGHYLNALQKNLNIPSSFNGTTMTFANAVCQDFFGGNITLQIDSQIQSEGQYNPNTMTVIIKDSVANTNSVAGIAIVAHEFGHAMQHLSNPKILIKNYKFSKFVKALGYANWLIIIFSIILSITQHSFVFAFVGLGLLFANFCIAIGLKLSTLQLEKNASTEALKIIETYQNFSQEEILFIKKFLGKAKHTYTADVLCAILGWTGLVRRTKYF